MMKKSVFVKTCSLLFATTMVAGAFTYSQERYEPKKIDFSAFKNAAHNISHLSEKPVIEANLASHDVTGDIVKTIEKEVKGKILRSRYSLNTEKVKRAKYEREVIAKNWNDIRPEFAAVDLKLDEVLLKTITSNEEAGEFEINNRELIKLYAFSNDSLRYETFGNSEIASVETKEMPETQIVNDEVKTAQASVTTKVLDEVIKDEVADSVSTQNAEPKMAENTEALVAETPAAGNDELVMFDYSDKEEVAETKAPAMKKTFDAPISNTVKDAIERAVHKSPTVAFNINSPKKKAVAETTTDYDALEKAMSDEDNVVYDYSNQAQAALSKKEETASEGQAFTASNNDVTTQVEFIIKAREINVNTQKSRQAFGYEFVPDYDRGERADDQATGEIKLGYSLSNDVNTQTGVVQSHGLIPTRVELNLLNKGINVPLINEAGIQAYLQKRKVDIVGNLLMVAIDPSISDVEIDSDYQAKIYFTQNFKTVESKDSAAYVMFMGVKSGNILLRYLLANKETAQKIVYVGDGEMYFEDPDFENTKRELYTFTTRSLLGRKVKELNINGSDVSFYGTKTTAKKKALNAYEIKVPELVNNSRKYLEFKHLGNSLFVGTDSATEIEIPGRDFIGRVLDANEMSEIGERCMVQVNLTKDLRDIKANGKNKSGEMFVETSFLDRDGNFSRDNSELSEKVFISGDMEGIFNVRLDYTDGSTDFLKTFCSEGSYLIEQL